MAVVLARRLWLRVRGAAARGAIQRLHNRCREQQLGQQMLRAAAAAAACSLPARSLITVPLPRPVCAPRSRRPPLRPLHTPGP